jgi:hypothetical protein
VHYTVIGSPWFVARRWNLAANAAAMMLAVPVIIPVRLSAGSTLHMVVGSGIYFVPACLTLCTSLDQSGQQKPVEHKTDVEGIGSNFQQSNAAS